MKLAASLALFLLLIAMASPAVADIVCGDTTCPSAHYCLDRGEGPQCWRLCQFHTQCESHCCTQIYRPFTAWICGNASECGLAEDGDLDDDSSDSEPVIDGDMSEIEVGESSMCDEVRCTSWQVCIITADDSEECAGICNVNSDCASGCCARISTGERVCIPASIECPQDAEVDGDGGGGGGSDVSVDLNPLCQSPDGYRGHWLAVIFLALIVSAWIRRKQHR